MDGSMTKVPCWTPPGRGQLPPAADGSTSLDVDDEGVGPTTRARRDSEATCSPKKASGTPQIASENAGKQNTDTVGYNFYLTFAIFT
jgi:hypothetical protein